MLRVPTPQGLEIVSVVRLLRASKDVGSVSPFEETHCDLRVQRDDSVPPALVALSRQRDETHVFREVSPRKLTHFLVWPEQATICKQAAQPEVFIELANLIEDRLDILEGLVQRWCLFHCRNGTCWIRQPQRLEHPRKEAAEMFPFCVEAGCGEFF